MDTQDRNGDTYADRMRKAAAREQQARNARIGMAAASGHVSHEAGVAGIHHPSHRSGAINAGRDPNTGKSIVPGNSDPGVSTGYGFGMSARNAWALCVGAIAGASGMTLSNDFTLAAGAGIAGYSAVHAIGIITDAVVEACDAVVENISSPRNLLALTAGTASAAVSYYLLLDDVQAVETSLVIGVLGFLGVHAVGLAVDIAKYTFEFITDFADNAIDFVKDCAETAWNGIKLTFAASCIAGGIGAAVYGAFTTYDYFYGEDKSPDTIIQQEIPSKNTKAIKTFDL